MNGTSSAAMSCSWPMSASRAVRVGLADLLLVEQGVDLFVGVSVAEEATVDRMNGVR